MRGQRLTTAADQLLRLWELYEAITQGDKRCIDAYLERCDPHVEVIASAVGSVVRTHGREELRRLLEQTAAGETRHRFLNVEVVEDGPDRAVVRTALLVLQGDAPLLAVPIEHTTEFRAGRMLRLQSLERRPDAVAADWAPLGSTVSTAGEILVRWGDECVLVRLRDGRPIELPLPAGGLEVAAGEAVMVFFEAGRPVGWYLPDRMVGVDLRRDGG